MEHIETKRVIPIWWGIAIVAIATWLACLTNHIDSVDWKSNHRTEVLFDDFRKMKERIKENEQRMEKQQELIRHICGAILDLQDQNKRN